MNNDYEKFCAPVRLFFTLLWLVYVGSAIWMIGGILGFIFEFLYPYNSFENSKYQHNFVWVSPIRLKFVMEMP
jgi:hypothetical protein